MKDSTVDEKGFGSSWWFIVHTKLYRYRALLRKYWWIVLCAALAGTCIGAWQISRKEVVYVSNARMIVSGRIAFQENGAFTEETGYFFGTTTELMQSQQVLKRAEARVQAMYPKLEPHPVALEVKAAPNAAIFNLKTTGPTPEYTQRILDAIMQEYIAFKNEMRSEKSEETQSKIADQIARLEKEIRDGDEELIEFQKKNNVGFLQEEGNSAGQFLAKLKRELAELKMEYQLLELLDLDQNLDRQRKPGATADDEDRNLAGRGMASVGPEVEYLRAKQQIELLKAERADYSRDLRPKHPIIVDLDLKIAQQEILINTYRQQSAEQLKMRQQSIKLQLENHNNEIKEWEGKALDLSQRLAEYNSIKAKLDRKKSERDLLMVKMNTVEVSRNIDQNIVSIMASASTPQPVKPGVLKTILYGFSAGLVVGVLILFVVDQLDDRVASFVEFQSRSHERVMAQIPRQHGSAGVNPLEQEDLRHAFVESFRSLRSSLFFMPFEGAPPKTFLITSSVPNEGKSTVSTNLAITMALADSKVLLVDGDLRRGSLHEQFGLKNQVGFGDVLRGAVPVDEVIQATSIPGLSLLSRGTSVPNPGELFLGKSTDAFLKTIYPGWDYVIIDTSPVMAADDTTSLAPKVDATLFVFRFTFSSSRVARKAIDLLRARQANVLGVICNDVDEAMQEYYYYQYPDYYGAKASEKHVS